MSKLAKVLLFYALMMNAALADNGALMRHDLYKKQNTTPGFYVRAQATKSIGYFDLDEIRTFVLVLKIFCGTKDKPLEQIPAVNNLEMEIMPEFLNQHENKLVKETTSDGYVRASWSGKANSVIKKFRLTVGPVKFDIDANAGPFVLVLPLSSCRRNSLK